MANVLFKKGLLNNLPSSHKEGTIYVTTDERAMYLDISDSERIRLGDFVEYDTWAEIQALSGTKISTTALYYAKQENVLCKWTGSGWKQINPDTIVKNTEVLMSATAIDGGATVTTKVTDSKGSLEGSLNIQGGGATTVSVADGKIVISSIDTNTDTKVTAVENHYAPVENSDSKLSATTGFITALKRDAAGHVVGIETSEQVTNGVTGVTLTTSGSDNVVTATTTVSQSVGDAKSGNLQFKGAGATTVSQENGVITITSEDNDSKVTSADNHYKATGVAAGTKSAEGTGDVVFVSGVTTDAAGHVTGITSGTYIDKDTHANIASVGVELDGANIKVTVTDTDGASANDSVALPTITLGTNEPIAVADGSYALPVYTKTETDNKITEAIGASNAMVLKGGLGGTDGLAALPTSAVEQGDTYIVLVAGTYGGVTAEVGDTFVAKADAVASTNDNWYYVPSGDDIATIAGIEGGFALTQGSEGTTTGQVVFTTNADGSMVPTITTSTIGSYQQVNVSYDMVWGSF